MAQKYNPAAPPKKVRKDKPGDSPKNYLNPFRTAHKKLKGEQPHRNV
tara:strand:- start:275 stop:415 length:141 start_codon:yes stop_codon:yes gene_type:complete